MRNEYKEIYEKLYLEYIYEQDYLRYRFNRIDELELLKRIIVTIDKSNKEEKLRSDAKYFLLVNFHNLIIKPILFNRHYVREIRDFYDNIETDIESDIITIIKESQYENEQVSGHQIIKAIDKIWNNLKTTELNIWGK